MAGSGPWREESHTIQQAIAPYSLPHDLDACVCLVQHDSGDGKGQCRGYCPFVPVKSDPESWKDERHRRGYAGEKIAGSYLVSAGWEILDHRFRLGRIEVDLIARKGSVVAFVEVKTRRGTGFGSPLEAVTWAKKREIVRVARGWMDRFGQPGDVYRFDVVGIQLKRSGGVGIEHVEDAFRPGWR